MCAPIVIVSAQDRKAGGNMTTRTAILVAIALVFSFVVCSAGPQWQDSILVKVEPINGSCEHCGSDLVKTNYSFKLNDGTIYIGQIGAGGVFHHRHPLGVTLNGHVKFRFETDDHVGDLIHILDDKGKDQKLVIVGKAVPGAGVQYNAIQLSSA